MRTGCQWRALPRQEYAPGTTGQGRLRQWVKAGVFAQAWQVRLAYSDQEVGIAWQWQALDGAMTKAPLGGEAPGPSRVDRAKAGAKHSVLTDRRGAPLAVAGTGANTPAKTVALETGDGIGMGVPRPERVGYRYFEDFLEEIGDVPLKEQMRGLHRMRNTVQHQGDVPSIESIIKYRGYAEDFFREICRRMFGMPYEELFLSQLIENENLRQQLLKAEEAFGKEEYQPEVRTHILTAPPG